MDLYEFENPIPRIESRDTANQQNQSNQASNQPLSYAAAAAISSNTDRPSYDFNSLPIPEQMGEYPAVTIPTRALERGLDYCKYCFLGRLDLKKLGIDRVRKIAADTWKPSGNWFITPIGKGLVFIRFDNPTDYNRIWGAGSTWVFDDEPLRISKWVPNFIPENQKQTRAMVWVRFPGLSQEYWEEESLMTIAMGVGNPMQVDDRTLNRDCGYFAQILVDVDFSKPIPEQVMVRAPKIGDRPATDFWQTVSIPKYPKLCNHCKVVGHLINDCTILQSESRATEASTARGNQSKQPQVPPQTLQPQIPILPAFHMGESSNAGQNIAPQQPRIDNGGWQVRNGRNNQNRMPNNQGPKTQEIRSRFGRQINGNRFQVLQREQEGVALNMVERPVQDPVEVTVTSDTTTRNDTVAQITPTTPMEIPEVSIDPIVDIAASDINHREGQLTNPPPPSNGHFVDTLVSKDSNNTMVIPSIETQNSRGVVVVGDSMDSTRLGGATEVPVRPEINNSSRRPDIDDPGDTGEGGGGPLEQTGTQTGRELLNKECEAVSNMLLKQNQIWADMLDDDEDEGDRDGRSVSRPSLSQPRRSERSRSRSKLLELYVSK